MIIRRVFRQLVRSPIYCAQISIFPMPGLAIILSLLPTFNLVNSAAAADVPVAEGRDDLSTYRLAQVPPNATN